MKIVLITALLLSTPAVAKGWSGAGSCSVGQTAFTSTEENCREKNGIFYPAVIGSPIRVIGPSNITISSSVKNCPEDRELVMKSGGGYGCARDIIDPQ